MTEQEIQQLLSNIAFINIGYMYIDQETIEKIQEFLKKKHEKESLN